VEESESFWLGFCTLTGQVPEREPLRFCKPCSQPNADHHLTTLVLDDTDTVPNRSRVYHRHRTTYQENILANEVMLWGRGFDRDLSVVMVWEHALPSGHVRYYECRLFYLEDELREEWSFGEYQR
jgi:hypothetical protein